MDSYLAQVLIALEKAQNGLLWYQELYPKHYSQADDELHEEIDRLLNNGKTDSQDQS
jgi:hypothetical protein